MLNEWVCAFQETPQGGKSCLLFSDENWWKGETQLGTGLFPASFVSSNLSVDPEPCEFTEFMYISLQSSHITEMVLIY